MSIKLYRDTDSKFKKVLDWFLRECFSDIILVLDYSDLCDYENTCRKCSDKLYKGLLTFPCLSTG